MSKVNPNKIVYVANVRLPTEKAHGVQIMHTCSALVKQGIDVELIIADREQLIKQDIFDYYTLPENFKITKLKTIGIWRPYYLGYFLQHIHFAVKLQWYLFWTYRYNCIVYSRDEFILFTLIGKVKNKFWESHEGKLNIFAKILLKFITGLVCISVNLKKVYAPYLPEEKILVAHDAVDVQEFFIKHDKQEMRKKYSLPLEKKLVMYIGKLDEVKGARTFAQASNLGNEDVQYIAIGPGPLREELIKNYPKLLVKEPTPYSQLKFLQQAADILVVPNSGKDKTFSTYTSPLKLFAHLASGVPVVCSSVPALEEVVSDKEVFFFQPDNPQSLNSVVSDVLQKSFPEGEGFRMGLINAKLLVQKYSWDARALDIKNFVLKLASCTSIK
jgi:glycosyltransferase involved in cell wall biosynthesis